MRVIMSNAPRHDAGGSGSDGADQRVSRSLLTSRNGRSSIDELCRTIAGHGDHERDDGGEDGEGRARSELRIFRGNGHVAEPQPQILLPPPPPLPLNEVDNDRSVSPPQTHRKRRQSSSPYQDSHRHDGRRITAADVAASARIDPDDDGLGDRSHRRDPGRREDSSLGMDTTSDELDRWLGEFCDDRQRQSRAEKQPSASSSPHPHQKLRRGAEKEKDDDEEDLDDDDDDEEDDEEDDDEDEDDDHEDGDDDMLTPLAAAAKVKAADRSGPFVGYVTTLQKNQSSFASQAIGISRRRVPVKNTKHCDRLSSCSSSPSQSSSSPRSGGGGSSSRHLGTLKSERSHSSSSSSSGADAIRELLKQEMGSSQGHGSLDGMNPRPIRAQADALDDSDHGTHHDIYQPTPLAEEQLSEIRRQKSQSTSALSNFPLAVPAHELPPTTLPQNYPPPPPMTTTCSRLAVTSMINTAPAASPHPPTVAGATGSSSHAATAIVGGSYLVNNSLPSTYDPLPFRKAPKAYGLGFPLSSPTHKGGIGISSAAGGAGASSEMSREELKEPSSPINAARKQRGGNAAHFHDSILGAPLHSSGQRSQQTAFEVNPQTVPLFQPDTQGKQQHQQEEGAGVPQLSPSLAEVMMRQQQVGMTHLPPSLVEVIMRQLQQQQQVNSGEAFQQGQAGAIAFHPPQTSRQGTPLGQLQFWNGVGTAAASRGAATETDVSTMRERYDKAEIGSPLAPSRHCNAHLAVVTTPSAAQLTRHPSSSWLDYTFPPGHMSAGSGTGESLPQAAPQCAQQWPAAVLDPPPPVAAAATMEMPALHPAAAAAAADEIMGHLMDCMDQSQESQQAIHDWDRAMGLRRSHSKTMRATSRSRKKLREMREAGIAAMRRTGVGGDGGGGSPRGARLGFGVVVAPSPSGTAAVSGTRFLLRGIASPPSSSHGVGSVVSGVDGGVGHGAPILPPPSVPLTPYQLYLREQRAKMA